MRLQENTVDWPTCDSTTPALCEDELSPPDGSGVVLIEDRDVPAGGSIYYRCEDHPDKVSNLGETIKVKES